MSIAMASSAQAQVFNWANNTSTTPQNWSVGTNWAGSAPVAGGSINDVVNLTYNFGSAAFASNNNLAGAYNLNSLNMDSQAAGGFTLSATAGSTLTFNTNGSLAAPTLVNSSSSAGTISSLITLANTTTINGAGSGGLTLSGVISGPGGLIINTSGSGLINLGAANTFAGGTTITSGDVAFSNATGLGPAGSTVTINGGRLRLAGAASLNAPNNFTLNSTLNLGGPSTTAAVTTTFSGSFTGVGGISYRPTASSTVSYTGNSNFTGAYYGQAFGNSVPSFTLSGNGAWTGVSGITMEANQTMLLDNSGTNVTNRINDAAPISLMRSGIQINGNAAAASTESLGNVSFSGSDAIAVVPNAAQNTTLTLASMARVNRGTLVFTGTNMGTAGGANTSNVMVTSPSFSGDLVGGGGLAGSTNISVLPYAYAANTVGGVASGQLVTFDPSTGFRPLAAAEYVPSAIVARGSVSNNNFKFQGATAMKGITSGNAMVLDSASAAGVGSGLYGPGGVQATGGIMYFSVSAGGTASTLPSIVAAQGGLDFGSAEGIIHSQNLSAVMSNISGSNGLNKAGFGQLFLGGNNTYTGTTTVSGSILHIASDSALGNAANGISLTGGNVSGIDFAPSVLLGLSPDAQSLTISRNVSLDGAGGGFAALLNNSTLTMSGVISGNGRLLSGTGFLGNTGVLKLTNTNTYSGPTVIFGNLAITSDGALGTNSEVVATGGFLRADGPVTSNRNFTVGGNSSTSGAGFPLITNGFDMTLNGTITNQGASTATTLGSLSKGGLNTLTLTANSQWSGNVQVGLAGPLGDMDHLDTGGTMVLSGNGALTAAPTFNVFSGSTLRLDNTGTNVGNRINGNVLLGGGTLELLGNGAAASTETMGTLTAASFSPAVANGAAVVNIAPGSGQSAVLTATNFTRTGASGILVRGTNLGGAIGANTANLVFNTAPTLTNGVIPGMVVDSSLSGNGTDLATYTAGTGVRALNSGEYTLNPGAFAAATNADLTVNTATTTATVNSMRMGGGAGGVTIAAANTLTVGSGMILATGGGNSGISGGTLAFAAVPAMIWANDNTAVSSVITGTGGLNKVGPGTMTLSTASTLTGGVTIAGGRLVYGVANAFPITNAMTVGTTGSVGVGTLDLNGNSSQIAGLGGFGKVELGGATLSTTGTAQFNGELRGTGNLTIGVGATTGSQTLAGVSSFTGQVRVTNGTLVLAANQPSSGNGGLGAAGNTVVLGDVPAATTFGTFTPNANVSRVAADITANGAAILNDATTSTINSAGSNNAIFSGNITVNRLLRLGGTNPSTTGFSGSNIFTGNVTDGSQPGGIDFFNGTHSLWGNNTFSGGVFLNATSSSYLGLGSDSALGTGFLKITSFSGNLHADNGARTINNNTYFTSTSATTLGIVGRNNFTFGGNWDLGGGDYIGQSPVSAAGARTFNVLNNQASFTGVISGLAAATLTKGGGGTLLMSGNNTFAGNVTVNGGGLIVNGTNSGAGTYTINNGALLGGSGTIAGAVTINAGAAVEPGNSPGTLTTGALTLATNSLLMWELGDSTVPAANDLTAVLGNLSVAGGTGVSILHIETLPGWALLPGTTTWTIMTYTGTLTGGPANFTITGLPTGTSGTIDTTTIPGSVLLNVVPAPSTGGLLALAGILAGRRRRRS